MAKFNDKVLCLFNKDYKQLKKEMERRGMVYESREKAIAKSIWKDAYDAGYNEGVIEGRNQFIKGGAFCDCSANCCGNAEPEFYEYCLYDLENATKYRLELTDMQATAIEWLIDRGLMHNVELFDWNESFEDVGRI